MSDGDRRLLVGASCWLGACASAVAASAVATDSHLVALIAAAPWLVICGRVSGRGVALLAASAVATGLLATGVLPSIGTVAGEDAALGTGLLLLTAAASGQPPPVAEIDRRRSTMRALRGLRALVDERASSPEVDVTAAVCRALTDLLSLRDCWYEPAPVADDGVPELAPDGTVDALVQRGTTAGLSLPARVSLPVRAGGRFVLVGDPDVGLSPERRQVAVLMADVVGLVPLPGRSPR